MDVTVLETLTSLTDLNTRCSGYRLFKKLFKYNAYDRSR